MGGSRPRGGSAPPHTRSIHFQLSTGLHVRWPTASAARSPGQIGKRAYLPPSSCRRPTVRRAFECTRSKRAAHDGRSCKRRGCARCSSRCRARLTADVFLQPPPEYRVAHCSLRAIGYSGPLACRAQTQLHEYNLDAATIAGGHHARSMHHCSAPTTHQGY